MLKVSTGCVCVVLLVLVYGSVCVDVVVRTVV